MTRQSSEQAELSRLRSQNAQLKVIERRYQILKRGRASRQWSTEPKPILQPASFALVDPRRVPRAGSKVLAAFSPPLALGRSMGAAIGRELRAMAIEVRTLIRALESVQGSGSAMADAPGGLSRSRMPGVPQAMDAVPGDAVHGFELLRAKWSKRFESLAVTWSRRMVTDVNAQTTAQMTYGLRDIATLQQIQSTLQTPRMRTIVEAATEQSVGLITRIPQRFLADVQVQVLRAITTGSGLNELVPYLTKRYKGDARHAHLTALDQIRKVTESAGEARMQSLGVEEYVWVATGGERYPRKLHHQHLNGKTFRYDDPPIIDEHTGERGKPGDAINCRCRSRPVVNFVRIGR